MLNKPVSRRSFLTISAMTAAAVALDWSKIGRGMIPDLGLLVKPAEDFQQHIANVMDSCQAFWNNLIVGQQRDVMISADLVLRISPMNRNSSSRLAVSSGGVACPGSGIEATVSKLSQMSRPRI